MTDPDGWEAYLDNNQPEGWSHDADIYGMDCSLICPCGVMIELDGTCPKGHESWLIAAGMI